jgi:hypothetical protein
MIVDPSEARASLIERELELIADRDFDGLRTLSAERAALVRTMPPMPPSGARDALLRCDGLQKRVAVELARVREAIVLELRQVRLAHRTAAGYRPAVQHTPHILASA